MIRKFRKQTFFGERIVKTGIAVFMTSLICILLGLPAHFAVIAAIVTIEPTAIDSLRKGFIRFPASAIGAALAVFFVWLWGESALAYAAAAIFTIFICMKLKLNDGILVATLTSVAMIPDISGSGNLVFDFISRLGTTSIGLIVSTLVNYFVFPPKYTPIIQKSLRPNFQLMGQVLEESLMRIINAEQRGISSPTEDYLKLRKAIEKLNEMSNYQEKEWKYHRTNLSEYREYFKQKLIITIMQKVVLHLGNLQYMNEHAVFTDSEKELLLQLNQSIQTILQDPVNKISDKHNILVDKLDQLLTYENTHMEKSDKYFHHFTPKTIVLYELLSLTDSLEELEQIHNED